MDHQPDLGRRQIAGRAEPDQAWFGVPGPGDSLIVAWPVER